MKQAGVSTNYQSLLYVLAATALFVSLSILPMKASALEVSTQTQQVVPPGGSGCAAISATNFTPYIYNGSLDSFEFTLPDASYVAIIGSVGNTLVPFELMTRSVDSSGNVRIHVDIAATPVTSTLPLQVTLLSARTGQPVCMAVVSMSIGTGPITSTPIPSSPTAPAVVPTPVTSTPSSGAGMVTTGNSSTNAPSTTTSAQTGTTSTTSGPVVSTMQNPFRGICATQASAYRLWLILLVLFTLIVGAALWAEFPMAYEWARTPERIATLILVLLLLLLGFWYLSVTCRAALWMPLLAFLIAVLGLLAAFWNHPRMTQLLLIQDSSL